MSKTEMQAYIYLHHIHIHIRIRIRIYILSLTQRVSEVDNSIAEGSSYDTITNQ